jgi:arylsulfatase A-like enzyme
VQRANDLYDDAIAHLDRRLGALLDELRRRGVFEDTLVIVTSDHGEHLGDHLLFFHGCSLYREVIEVLLVNVQANAVPAGRVLDVPVSLRDSPATVLDLLGIGRSTAIPGQSLARFWYLRDGAAHPRAEPLLMETDRPLLLTSQGREPAAKGPMNSVVAAGMHSIRAGDATEELYHMNSDPEERMNLANRLEFKAVLENFRIGLQSMLRRRPPNHGRTASMGEPRLPRR